MTQEIDQALVDSYRAQDTAVLIEMLRSGTAAKGDDDLRGVTAVLERRQQRFPSGNSRPRSDISSGETRSMNADCNASVCQRTEEKLEVHFPDEGFLRSERSVFQDQQDLVAYLGEVFSVPYQGDSMQMSMRRRGKYRRLGRNGRPAFTFGDPILDLITDERGWVTIGDETYNFLAAEIASPRDRGGGNSSIDLGLNHEEILRQQLIDAVAGAGNYALVENSDEAVIIASTNPSSLDFYRDSGHMRFRSWKKNRFFYRSIGTEIETWGGKFTAAWIQSQYASPVIPSSPFVCGIDKFDSDSDTNDDYVDEYEVGVFASPASTVRSFCEAQWKGGFFEGTVSKGSCEIFM